MMCRVLQLIGVVWLFGFRYTYFGGRGVQLFLFAI